MPMELVLIDPSYSTLRENVITRLSNTHARALLLLPLAPRSALGPTVPARVALRGAPIGDVEEDIRCEYAPLVPRLPRHVKERRGILHRSTIEFGRPVDRHAATVGRATARSCARWPSRRKRWQGVASGRLPG
eukprot:scaffold25176_cov30-Tisochrysis_lutea.AAC.2